MGIEVGQTVRLRQNVVRSIGEDVRLCRQRATVVSFIADIEGGVVLDRHIGGFRCWNVKDLAKGEFGGNRSARIYPSSPRASNLTSCY